MLLLGKTILINFKEVFYFQDQNVCPLDTVNNVEDFQYLTLK